jgi:hypothetical protein
MGSPDQQKRTPDVLEYRTPERITRPSVTGADMLILCGLGLLMFGVCGMAAGITHVGRFHSDGCAVLALGLPFTIIGYMCIRSAVLRLKGRPGDE